MGENGLKLNHIGLNWVEVHCNWLKLIILASDSCIFSVIQAVHLLKDVKII